MLFKLKDSMANQIEITKKGYTKDTYQDQKILELARCMVDPVYFIEKYVMIQHPLQGRIKFVPYSFQVDMIRAFHDNRNIICCTSRQMGKTTTYLTIITKNGKYVKLGSLIPLNFREKIVAYFENLLLKYATVTPYISYSEMMKNNMKPPMSF